MANRLFLQGQYVRLEPMSPEHATELLIAATEERSTFTYTPVPFDPETMATYVASAIAKRYAGDQLPFVTRQLSTGRVVGATRFYDLAYWNWPTCSPDAKADGTRQGPDTGSIGYTWLTPSAQRTPVNTEAKLLMLDHAFLTWEARVIRIQTDARNLRSRQAIERLGCSLEGILRCERPAVDGSIRHTARYSMLSDEWPANRIRLLERLAIDGTAEA